ncbi:MAG: AbrB/MazE/SpoVT family DNA-binding domain-containing protein [Candidatus Woesearchaeota archaeon]
MKRKLVKQGASTMMVSLPAKWIKALNLDKGSEVDISETSEGLLISSNYINIKMSISLKLVGNIESSIRTLIVNTYRRGYDKIIIEYDNEIQYNHILSTLKDYIIGFDVTEKKDGCCIIENITEPAADQFDNILNKIFYNITELFLVVDKIFTTSSNYSIYLNECNMIEERIQKYDNFCRRSIAKQKNKIENSEFLWGMLVSLNHAQRKLWHSCHICKDIKLSSNIFELLNGISSLYENIKKAFLEKDMSALSKVHHAEKKLIRELGYKILEKSKGKEGVIVFYLLMAAREFYQTNSSLSGLLMID